MKILSIDTSSTQLVIAFSDNGRVCGMRVEAFRRLSRMITPAIKRLLEAVSCPCGSIDYFGCGLGPGSFTGLRVGMAAMKGLAWPLGKPMVGVLSLDTIAAGAPEDARHIIVAVDARRGMVYCARYAQTNGTIIRLAAPRLISSGDLFRLADRHCVILGDAAGLYRDELRARAPSSALAGEDYWYPQPQHLARLALDAVRARRTIPAADIEPVYLYPKECQIKK